MELRSQAVRKLAPENDPLKIGMGWKVDDLAKPQIMVESTFGDSHPGSAHLDQFVKEAVQAVNTHGGKAARYFATDMCDGIAQGHDGINYSLPHRDAIVNLVEAQANATVYDGGVFIASCDKSMPAMLMSIGRLKDMSAIVVTGGVMEAHTLPKKYVVNDPACAINDLLTLEQIGKFDAWEKTGVIPNEQLDYYKHNACPSCGACSFMGTASTMQIMAEALGLMLPGTALMPATAPELKQAAYDAGVQVMKLVAEGIKAKDIITMKSFENAIMVHAAISGSTNATMHLPAIAHEFGFEIDADTFDRMHRGAHYLLNIRPSGDWPAQYFYYAGGVPRVMEEIKSMLHLDVMTVTGKTLGENLEELKKNGFYQHCDAILAEKTAGFARPVSREDIIHSFDNANLWCGVPVLIVLLIRIFAVGFYEIPSRSMMDTMVPGDRVVTSKLTPKIFDLQRGDVVVFKDPNNWLNEEQSSAPGGGYLIKRLIGLPGDVVECKGAGQPVTINGVAINETSYIRPGVDPSAFPFSVTVTEGRVFVMGDNRANSADSRYHQDDGDRGLVPISDVVGVGIAKYWPLDRLGAIDDHHEVFKDVPDASGSNS